MPEQTFNPDATLAQYADSPAQLEAILNGLTESDLELAQPPDTWTVRQIVHHIVDGDDIWKSRDRQHRRSVQLTMVLG